MIPYYEDETVILYCGDAAEILPQLAPVDHVITDPPYGMHTHTKQWIGAALTNEGAPRTSPAFTELGFDPLTAELRREVARQCGQLARRWVLVFSDLEGVPAWNTDLSSAGLEPIRTCIWDKVDSAPQFTGDRPAAGCEAIVVAHRPGRKVWNGGGRRNVFRHAVNGDRGAKPHPSTKPLSLMRELVTLFTDSSETILDPFAGSGTTLLAARQLGRKAIGIELNEAHCRTAVERLTIGIRAARAIDAGQRVLL